MWCALKYIVTHVNCNGRNRTVLPLASAVAQTQRTNVLEVIPLIYRTTRPVAQVHTSHYCYMHTLLAAYYPEHVWLGMVHPPCLFYFRVHVVAVHCLFNLFFKPEKHKTWFWKAQTASTKSKWICDWYYAINTFIQRIKRIKAAVGGMPIRPLFHDLVFTIIPHILLCFHTRARELTGTTSQPFHWGFISKN